MAGSRKSEKSRKSRKSSSRKSKKSSTRSRKSVGKNSSTRSRKSVDKKSSTRSRKSVDKKSATRSRKSAVKKSARYRKSNKRPVIIEEEKTKQVVKKMTRDRSDVIFGKGGIESVSGPVSFYYLRPKKKVYDNSNGQYFPLIVLFGDSHRSLENTCKPCVCSHSQKNGCCYKLSDPHFLRKLDTLADARHPVDFYVETLLSGTGDGFKGGVMEDMTTGEMISCYHHRLRGTMYDKCPTKMIRWQAGETRDTWSWINYDNDDFKKKLYQNPLNIPKMEKTIWIEQQFSTILRYFSLLKKDITPYTKLFRRKQISDLLSGGVFKNIKSLQVLLLTLCDGKEDDKPLTFNTFANVFFSLFTKENSLIYKQIEKQTYGPFRSFQQWIDFYVRSLEFSVKNRFISISSFSLKNVEKQKLRETILKLPSALSGPLDFQFNDQDIYNLSAFLHINIPLVDIYTIARLFKQPTDGIRSSLSFGYFGYWHIQNMVNLLLSTNAYEIAYENPFTYDVSRCQTFDVTLNLSKEVRKHNRKIDGVSENIK